MSILTINNVINNRYLIGIFLFPLARGDSEIDNAQIFNSSNQIVSAIKFGKYAIFVKK